MTSLPSPARTTVHRGSRPARPGVLLIAALAAACGGDGPSGPKPPPPAAAVASVAVTPATGSVQVGRTLQLSASPRDAAGNVLSGRTLTWSSSAEAVARVDASGVVTGVAPGPVTITATSEGRSGTASLTVTAVPVASVLVTPATATVVVGQTVALAASPRDELNNVLSGRTVVWSSGAPAIATVNAATGVVQGVAQGSAQITATSEGRSGSATVTVTPPAPTTHAGVIAASETWRAADNPHLVTADVIVRGAGSPVLTIEPGVIVRFNAAAGLLIGEGGAGGLRALGTAAAPIRFESSAATPARGAWKSVHFGAQAVASEVRHASLSHCGGSDGFSAPDACIVILGSATRPELDTVSIAQSGGAGAALDDGGGFAAGSARLSVENGAGSAVSVQANQAGSIPAGGTFTGNARNAVEIRSGNVTQSQAWPALGIPYLIMSDMHVAATPAPTLTLPAGAELRMAADAEVIVGYNQPGALVAAGTTAAPIRFTADAATPSKGFWDGIVIESRALPTTRFANVVLEYCGGDGWTALDACLVIVGEGSTANGGARPEVDTVTVRNSAGDGVGLANGGAFGSGSSHLTVTGSDGYAVSVQPNWAGSIPVGGTFTGNARDAIQLRNDGYTEVRQTQTWPNVGVPYVVEGAVMIRGDGQPALTLQPGTELRMEPGAQIVVGYSQSGALAAAGSAAAPIRFTANTASPSRGFWDAVVLASGTLPTTRFAHVVMEYCGGDAGWSAPDACLIILGNGSTNNGGARPDVDTVTIRNSAGAGVSLAEGGAFGSSSSLLTVTSADSYPVTVQPNWAGSIPTGGAFTGNGIDAVFIRDDGYTELRQTQTWANLGIPYVIERDVQVRGAGTPVLTLQPGTIVRMNPASKIVVGYSQPGALVAQGTAAAPILFTANTSTPTRGYWGGLVFEEFAVSPLRLDHVIVEYGGGAVGWGRSDANILVLKDKGAFITNSTIRHSAECGITRYWSTGFATDFTAPAHNNVFANNARASQCLE